MDTEYKTNDNNNDITNGSVDKNVENFDDRQDKVYPTPEFSDGYEAINFSQDEKEENISSGNEYMGLFNTYKQLFENLTDDVDEINLKFNKLTELVDKNIRETNSAIRATQIYAKLFTKISVGANVLFFLLIIVLFLIK